jgi:glycosyltransferase involved in cell wall biosynthesis
MSKKNRKIKILLIGAMPPPVGGITVHLSRFIQKNSQNENYDLRVLDIRKLKLFEGEKKCNFWQMLAFILTCRIVHIHLCSNVKVLLAAMAKLAGKITVYTHHDSRVSSFLAFNVLLWLCDKIILVNEHDLAGKDRVKLNGRCVYIPAFISPSNEISLPEDLKNKITQYKFVVSTNCFSAERYNGGHIYGYDIIVNAFKLFTNRMASVKSLLILVDPNSSAREIVAEKIDDFNRNNENEIFYYARSLDFSSLIKSSSVVVRATRTDGDALTVREALYCGVPVVASNCRCRPEGTLLFDGFSYVDLAEKLEMIYKGEINAYIQKTDFNDQILSVYKSLIDERHFQLVPSAKIIR